MPRISIDNYDTVASWNGSQDLFIVEQPDGTKVATPAMVKQFIEAGNFTATGEITDEHGNILKDMAKSADVNTALAGKQDTLTVDTISGSGNYSCSYTAYKYGKVVYLFVTGVTNATTGQGMLLFTLPEGWRPRARARAYGSIAMGSMAGSSAIGFNVDATGQCTTYSYIAFSSGGFTVTYISE